MMYEELKKWRLEKARELKIAAFCILDNKCLSEITNHIPNSKESLLKIKGMGPVKVNKYGDEILKICSQKRYNQTTKINPHKIANSITSLSRNNKLEYIDRKDNRYAIGIYHSIRSRSHGGFSKKILEFKENKNSAINYFYDKIKEINLNDYDLIIHVPSHSSSSTSPSSKKLCEKISKKFNIKNGSGFIKRVTTTIKSSTAVYKGKERLNAKQHYKSMSFSKSNDINNKNILIFDDVITSSASFNACKHLLLQCGKPRSIHGLFLSKTARRKPKNYSEDFNIKTFGSSKNVSSSASISKMTPLDLGKSSKRSAILPLIEYLKKGTPNERRLAASAIGKLKNDFLMECKKAIPYLINNLGLIEHPQVIQYSLSTLLRFDKNHISKTQVEKIKNYYDNESHKDYNGELFKKILNKYNMSTEKKYNPSLDPNRRSNGRIKF